MRKLVLLVGVVALVLLGGLVAFLVVSQAPLPILTPDATPTENGQTDAQTEEAESNDEKIRGEIRLAKTLADFDASDLLLSGLNGSQSIWVPLPSDWVVEDIVVNLNYIASPLLHSERATFSVLSNGQAMTSLRPINDGARHEIAFRVSPESLYQGSGFLLEFKGFLAVTGDVCEVQQMSGQWLTVLSDSRLIFTASFDRTDPQLETLAQKIIVQDALDPQPVVFVLPDAPDTTTLTVAAQVASRLGQDGNIRKLPFDVLRSSSADLESLPKKNLVVLGLPQDNAMIEAVGDKLPAKLEGDGFLTEDGEVAPASHGVIQILNLPTNTAQKLLLVSAGDETGLQLAGKAFATSSTFKTLTGAYKFIESIEPPSQTADEDAWQGLYTSFEQLDTESRRVRGIGVFGSFYNFPYPAGWLLGGNSQLILDVDYSPSLDAGAHFSLYINDVLIGTRQIGEGIDQHRFTFDLPVEQINDTLSTTPGQLNVNVEVANLVVINGCEQISSDTIWTEVLSTSHFITSPLYKPVPDLQIYPYPFVNGETDAPLAIILPPEPTDKEIGMGLAVAAILGNRTSRDYRLSMFTADEVSDQVLADSNLIVLGEQTRQPFVDKVLAQVPTGASESVYRDLQKSTTGLLREVVSPWNGGRVILLAYGETTESFERAGKALLGSGPLVPEKGTNAFIPEMTPTPTSTVVPLSSQVETSPTPTLKPTMTPTQSAQ